MPILSYFRICEYHISYLGSCAFTDGDTFRKRVNLLFEAMDWPIRELVVKHGYLGSMPDDGFAIREGE